jgi:MFS family permease
MTGGVSVRQRLAVFSVALGTFTLVTNEFLPVALLTGIRTSLRVSQEAAATMVTVPAMVAAIASPALAVAAGRLDRRLVLLLMAGLFTVSDTVSAAAPNFATMLLGRFLLGGVIAGRLTARSLIGSLRGSVLGGPDRRAATPAAAIGQAPGPAVSAARFSDLPPGCTDSGRSCDARYREVASGSSVADAAPRSACTGTLSSARAVGGAQNGAFCRRLSVSGVWGMLLISWG